MLLLNPFSSVKQKSNLPQKLVAQVTDNPAFIRSKHNDCTDHNSYYWVADRYCSKNSVKKKEKGKDTVFFITIQGTK